MGSLNPALLALHATSATALLWVMCGDSCDLSMVTGGACIPREESVPEAAPGSGLILQWCFWPCTPPARCLCCPSALSAPLLLCSPVTCFPSMALPSLGSFMEVEGSSAGSFWPSCGVRCGQAWGLWRGSGFDPGALKVGQSCFVACKDASSGWGRFQASSEPGLVLGWGTWHRVTLKCCSEAGATPLSRGHQEARRALPVGLAPFPCLAWASSPPSTWQGWGGGRWGTSCGSISVLHPHHRFSASLGFFLSWHALGRGSTSTHEGEPPSNYQE